MSDQPELPEAATLLGPRPTELPDASELLGPRPQRPPLWLGPEADEYAAASEPLGRVLRAIGQGATTAWESGENLGYSDDVNEALKQAGIYPDVGKGQGGLLRTYNEAMIRPLVAGTFGVVGAINRGIGSVISGGVSGLVQGATEVGGEQFGRGIGGVAESILADTGAHMPMGLPGRTELLAGELASNLDRAPLTAPEVSKAAELGVVGPGGREAWYSSGPATATQDQIGTMTVTARTHPVEGLEPVQEPPATIHEAARAIDPETFSEYDALDRRKAELRAQIDDAQAEVQRNAESQAPHQAEIADLNRRLEDTTPRLAKKYQARLDEITPAHDAFADSDQMALLSRETPEIAALRQELMAADYRMRDLAPDVTAAYREAAKGFPEAAEAQAVSAASRPEPVARPAEAAAEPAPEPVQAATPAPGAQAEPVPAAPAPVPVTAQAPSAPAAAVDIAADVTRKLVAAGRPTDEAGAAAEIVAAHYESRAARFDGAKGTASDLYTREAPDIVAGRQRVREMAQGRLRQTTRGKIRLDDGRSVITLMQDANASTFLHETGHAWLEELLSDARDEAAPEELRNDASTVRKWLNAEPEASITTAQHERFARGFERYMMEGVAPSSRLAGVFAQFKNWLTSIYQTVTRLRAPISDDIRDVFNRLLSSPTERPVIAPDLLSEIDRGRDMSGSVAPFKPADPYENVPKEPKRLIQFLKEGTTQFPGTIHETRIPGGVRDVGGDISAIIGGPKGRPGLINNRSGRHLDSATEQAWESGYLPEHSDRPEINHLLDKIREDHTGNPQYSIHDQDAAEAYHAALSHNAEIDRLASEHGIDTKGLTREQFFDKVTDKLSIEDQAAELRNLEGGHNSGFGDLDAEVRDITEPPWYGIEAPRSLEELENADRQENDARSARQGDAGDSEPRHAAGPAEHGEVSGRQGGRGDGPAGRDGQEDGQQRGGGRSDSSAAGSDARESVSAAPTKAGSDELVDKAGNIRLDNLNSPDDVKQVLRDLASRNADFMVTRGGVISDVQRRSMADNLGLTVEGFDPVKPPGVTPSVWAEAVQKLTFQASTEVAERGKLFGESGSPADGVAYLQAKQRLLLIADHFAGLTAEAGRTLRVFDKGGMSFTGDLVAKMQQDTGKTLFQMQQEARAVGALETAAQRSKMMQDTRELTRWEKIKGGIISYFINNLISGPITHAGYAVGNEVWALFKAIPLTAAEATIDATRAAFGTAPADRVYYGEVGAQLYGMMHGTLAGLSPGWTAFKTGISYMEGAERLAASERGGQGILAGISPIGEAALRQSAIAGALETARVPAGIAGKVGYALETPSRIVSAIHTVFYAMNYEREIARQAFRAASREAISGGISALPPIAPGFVRLYHGGSEYAGGSRWLTESRSYAEGYAKKSDGILQYVDLQEGGPELANVAKSFDDTGTGQRAPYVHFDAPPDVAQRLQPATAPNLTGLSFANRVAEIKQSPPIDMVQSAHDEALGAVLMKRPAYGGAQSHLAALVNNSLPLKLAMPFMQVGMNILEEGVVKSSPLAVFSQAIRDDMGGKNGEVARTQAYARIMVGTGVAAGVVGLAAQGIITGGGPSDPRELALKEATGWKAYSVRIGDTYIPFRKYLGPLGPLVGGAANMYEIGHLMSDDHYGKAAVAAIAGFTEVVANETWMSGLAKLTDLAKHADTNGERYLRDLALDFVPGAIGLSQTARMTDQYQREVHSWTDALRNKLPGLSQGLYPQRDWAGRPIDSHTMMSPSVDKQDRTTAAMQAAEFYPAKLPHEIMGVPLSAKQYDDYARVAGQFAKMRLDALVPSIAGQPSGIQHKVMAETLTGAREAGATWVKLQPENANIIRQAIAAKQAQMQGRTQADVKDIRRTALPAAQTE